jgi:hypothetical protein
VWSHWLSAAPLLTNVNFGLCNQLTDTSMVALAKGCPLLRIVDFFGCKELTLPEVALAKHCPKLTNFDVRGCTQLTETSLAALEQGYLVLPSFGVASLVLGTDETSVLAGLI